MFFYLKFSQINCLNVFIEIFFFNLKMVEDRIGDVLEDDFFDDSQFDDSFVFFQYINRIIYFVILDILDFVVFELMIEELLLLEDLNENFLGNVELEENADFRILVLNVEKGLEIEKQDIDVFINLDEIIIEI